MKVALVFVGFLLLTVVNGLYPDDDDFVSESNDVDGPYKRSFYDSSMDSMDLDSGENYDSRPNSSPIRRGKMTDKPKAREDCWMPMLDKAVTSLRGFPGTEKVTNDLIYDPTVYEPMVERFWANREKDRFEAIKMFRTELITELLQQRYQCPGTKLNQILLYVLEKEARPYINKTITESLPTMLQMYPQLKNRVFGFVQRIFDNDVLGYVEEEEFESIGCFLRELRRVFSQGSISLEEMRSKFSEAALRNDDVFTCTDPQEVFDYYRDGLDIMNAPIRKNILYWHLKKLLKGLVQKQSPNGMKKFKMGKLVHKLAAKMLKVYRDSVKHLEQVFTFQSEDALFQFLGKYMSDDMLRRARSIIEDLNLYSDVGSGSYEDEDDDSDEDVNLVSTTPSSPVRRNKEENLKRALELLRELNDKRDYQYQPEQGYEAKRGM